MGVDRLLLTRTKCALERRNLHDTNERELIHWYALCTRARHEKKVRERLDLRGLDVFLPLIPRERQWHDRKKIVEVPLFAGYVFARFEEAMRSLVLGTPGVASVVGQGATPSPIRDEEIEGVRRLVEVVAETGEIPGPSPTVRRGQAVEVTAGPLAGVRGVVAERRGERALVQIGVAAIGQGIKVEVAGSDLRTLDDAEPARARTSSG